MKKRLFALLGLIISSAIILSACRKINDATELGGDLIPAVDNINTFDTILTVETYNGIFNPLFDSTRLTEEDEHFLGMISNDPVFGQTEARLFLELKPPYYRYTFENKSDSLHIDSVVLVLSYNNTYGDTNAAQTVRVYEIDNNVEFRADSNYMVSQNSITYSNLLGQRTFSPSQLKDSVKVPGDTTVNQLRIRLDNAFGQRLLDYDTNYSSVTGAYYSDSLFRTKLRGFALESVAGNAIMSFSLTSVNTKLVLYYRYDKNDTLNYDTTYRDFGFTLLSANANYITRTHPASISSIAGDNTEDEIVYIQNTPGTFTTVKIPGLASLSNRVVHRAELVMEQLYDGSDTVFTIPASLMLDAYDPSISAFRTIPYDMSPDQNGTLSPYSFGGLPFKGTDGSNSINVWRFNISRYVQNVVNNTLPAYDLRVFSPFYIFDQFGIPGKSTDVLRGIFVNPTVGKGRVRLGGGNHPTQRMRLRIIYSKI